MRGPELERALRAQADYKAALAGVEDLEEMRRLDAAIVPTWSGPLPGDVEREELDAGGVPAVRLAPPGAIPGRVLMYLHGGAFVLGSPDAVTTPVARAARVARASALLPRYRLAPEHPYPAMVEDAVAAYLWLIEDGTPPEGIVIGGESAGGGLAVATLVNARDHGLPLPAAAYLMSPYADLTLAGTTMQTKRDADPLLSPQALQARVPDYTSGHDPALGLISPVFADLSGLPPLVIQAGTHEVLLDDAIRLARQAATADVEITLDITPGVPHVFQAYYPILDEATAALDRAGQLLSVHLASAERVTA